MSHRLFKDFFCIVLTAISIFLHGLLPAQADDEPAVPEKRGKTVKALKANPHPPTVDGFLNDEIWQKAQTILDFVQEAPLCGKPPTEQTEVRVVFDAKAIYVAVRAFDAEPSRILDGRSGGDPHSDSDWIAIAFDSKHDHQTAYSFRVNPAGVRSERFLHNDTLARDAWKAKWQVKTQIDSLGWTAEFRIPFSQLRLTDSKNQTWGFNVWRTVGRKNERIAWVHKPAKATGDVSRFGHLTGIVKIEPPEARLLIMPYAISYAVDADNLTAEQRAIGRGFGADIEYKLSSRVALDATINPNFDQIEADPVVLNLTAYETFFPNKRPFFIESAKIFRTPFRLFHPWRIGNRPNRFRVEQGDKITQRPRITTIYGAARVSGKTASGTTFGIVNAVTANEYAAVTDVRGEQQQRRIEPFTNYFAGRLQKNVLKGNSTIGLTTTAVNRDGSESAYAGGFDWNLNLKNRAYNFKGQIAASFAGLTPQRGFGYGAEMSFARTGKKWLGGSVDFVILSPELQINDLGYLKRNNWLGIRPELRISRSKPFAFIQHYSIGFGSALAWNYQRNMLDKGIDVSHAMALSNNWQIAGGFGHNFRRVDDADVFRGGTLILQPADNHWWLQATSNRRKRFVISPNLSGGWDENGGTANVYRLAINFNPSKAATLYVAAGYNTATDAAQWVSNVDADRDGQVDHYVYGKLQTNIVDAIIKGTVSFIKNLTLQVYLQPYIAVGNYSDFRELTRPLSFDFVPYDYTYNLDFNSKYLNSNLMLRWEYRRKAHLYFVWSQSRSDYSKLGDFRFGREVNTLFSAPGTDVYLVKLDFGLSLL